jgi:hypothetical protein
LSDIFSQFENLQEREKRKKFVFQINPENIEYIEEMAYDEKNDLINQLLNEHKIYSHKKKKEEEILNWIKKIALILLMTAIGIPVFVKIIGISLDMTVESYQEIRTKFEKLY